MNILFENAALAWLAAAVAVPPLVHLFARARPPRWPFGATHLVLRVVRNTMRLKRPKDWLLLLLRTFLFAALVLAFLRPLLFLGAVPVPGETARSVVVLLDRSASMAWTEGGQSRFAAACAEASEILDGLSSRDKANVVWLDAEPDAIFPALGANVSYLRRRLLDARATNESGSPAAALDLCLSMLREAAGRCELYIVSDFQAGQWQDVRVAVPDPIRVHTLSPVREPASNGAVLSIRTEPVAPLAGEPVQIVCEVANFCAAPRKRTVTLEIGARRVSREVMLAAWGTGAAVVEHTFAEPARVPVEAQLDEDAFGMDDWRGTLVPVREALRVGLYGTDPHTAPVWTRALRALPWTELVTVSLDQPERCAGCDLLMLAGWKGEHADRLARLRADGLPLVCAPAEGVSRQALAVLAGLGPAAAGATVAWESLGKEIGLQLAEPDNRVFTLFRDGEFGDPAQAAFRKRLRLPVAGLKGQALISFADGLPALYLCDANPACVLWAAPLSAGTGDWATQLPFLPFFGELVGSLRARRAHGLQAVASPGATVSWLAPIQAESVRLADEQGDEIAVTESSRGLEGRMFVSDPIARPGAYRWYDGATCREVRMVNFPAVESDLRTAPPPELSAAGKSLLQRAADLRAAREGRPLWKMLAWLAVALLLAESAVVLWCDLETRRLTESLE